MKELKIINLGYNRFIDMPNILSHFKQLEILNLEANLIKKIPNSIVLISKLKELNIYGNRLNDLPSDISALEKLESINAGLNNFTKLPKGITHLQNLKNLEIACNHFDASQELMNKIPGLEKLVTTVDKEVVHEWLLKAVLNNHIPLVERLLEEGIDINYQFPRNGKYNFTTALFEAKSVDMVKLLIEKGADVNLSRICNEEKKQPIAQTFLTKKNSSEITKYIKQISPK
jgi:hypothetical protein